MGRQSRSKKSRSPLATEETTNPLATFAGERLPRLWFAIAVVLIALTLAVYAQVARHQFLNYDDSVYLTENIVVQRGLTVDGIRWAFTSLEQTWHPLTWLSLMTDVELFGVNAAASHLVNVALHIASVLLLFALLTRMTGAVGRSAIVAALFAIHPLHVESVAWVAERKDVLSTVLLLLTIWLYVDWTGSRSRATYAWMLITFIAGMTAKQMLVTLPFVLLLLDYWPLRRLELNDRISLKARFLEKIPLFAVTALGIAISLVGQRAAGAIVKNLPLHTRVLNAIGSYGLYLWKTVIPADLALPYPYTATATGAAIVSLVVLLGITATVVMLRDSQRYLFTGWFWFVGTFVPVIGLVQIGTAAMADRYTYVPHIGLFVAVVWGIGELASRPVMRRIAAGAAAVAIAVLAVLAYRQTAFWRDSKTLFAHTLKSTSNNFIAHLQLAAAQSGDTEYESALANFRRANQLDPASVEARQGVATTLLELAKIDRSRNDDEAAMRKLDEAKAIAPDDKTRAAVAMEADDTTKAIELYTSQLANSKDPTEAAKAHNDLGAALGRAGRDEEAVAEYRKAIVIAPRQYDARLNLGTILSRLDRNDEAIEQFKAAASIQPQSPEPHVYLALAYTLTRRYADALASARRAYALDPRASNLRLTNALRRPFKETNFEEFMRFLESKSAGPER